MAKLTDDASLKRLGGGRWQSRDERFTVEPQSGTWVVVDADQTDDLGLPLVRGPFGSLAAAKAAIADARTSPPAPSPLPLRAERLRPQSSGSGGRATRPPRTTATRTGRKAPAVGAGPAATAVVEPPEPRWIAELEPDDRRRARRLVERLTNAGAADPEGIARCDLVGEVPAAAAFAVLRALDALGADASPADVARLVADGRDDDLGVRWHLVDGEGRRIILER